jgi:hypothetical protein
VTLSGSAQSAVAVTCDLNLNFKFRATPGPSPTLHDSQAPSHRRSPVTGFHWHCHVTARDSDGHGHGHWHIVAAAAAATQADRDGAGIPSQSESQADSDHSGWHESHDSDSSRVRMALLSCGFESCRQWRRGGGESSESESQVGPGHGLRVTVRLGPAAVPSTSRPLMPRFRRSDSDCQTVLVSRRPPGLRLRLGLGKRLGRRRRRPPAPRPGPANAASHE